MKMILLFLAAVLTVPALFGAADFPLAPLSDWNREFRPDNKREIHDVKVMEGFTRLRRFPGSSFGRIYCDLALKPGATYRLTYAQSTGHGALVKMLVIFRGPDGKWREKTRLSNYEPLVNGQWRTGSVTFTVPEDAPETRIDFRLDSFGTVDLKDVALTELTAEEAKAYAASVEVKPFRPGEGSDVALQPGRYYRVSFEGRSGEGEGTLKLVFHDPEKGFVRDGSVTFYCRGAEFRPVREVIVAADNVDGVRISQENCEIRNLNFEEFELKK